MTTTIRLDNGLSVRTATRRRYVVIATRSPDSPIVLAGNDDAFASILFRSDNITTARKRRDRYGWIRGAHAVVYDTVTGSKVG